MVALFCFVLALFWSVLPVGQPIRSSHSIGESSVGQPVSHSVTYTTLSPSLMHTHPPTTGAGQDRAGIGRPSEVCIRLCIERCVLCATFARGSGDCRVSGGRVLSSVCSHSHSHSHFGSVPVSASLVRSVVRSIPHPAGRPSLS
jgi:hypothetical protein